MNARERGDPSTRAILTTLQAKVGRPRPRIPDRIDYVREEGRHAAIR